MILIFQKTKVMNLNLNIYTYLDVKVSSITRKIMAIFLFNNNLAYKFPLIKINYQMITEITVTFNTFQFQDLLMKLIYQIPMAIIIMNRNLQKIDFQEPLSCKMFLAN